MVTILGKIKTLSLDLETYSDINLVKAGVYKYAESPNFEILLLGASINDGPVDVYDLTSGDTVPDELIAAIADDDVIKWSFNASFERIACPPGCYGLPAYLAYYG